MENTAKQVLHMQPRKGFTTAQSNEHQRRWTEAGWENAIAHGNYDRSRERLNFEIGKGGVISPIDKSRSMPVRMAENLRERGIKDPNEGLEEPKFRTIADFILSGSRDQMRKLAFGDQKVNYEAGFNEDNLNLKRMPEIEEWAKDMYRFMCDRYGEENIIGFYVHLDEVAPHIHCTIMPIEDGKFAFKKIFAGSNKYEFSKRMHELHDALAKVNEKWNLQRGAVAPDGEKKRYVTTDEYRRKITEWSVLALIDLDEKRRLIEELRKQVAIAERRVKGLTTMIENLTLRQREYTDQIRLLSEQLKTDEMNREAILYQISKLKEKLTATEQKLADKEEKLRDADHTLEDLRQQQEDIADVNEKLREETRNHLNAAQDRALLYTVDALCGRLMAIYKRIPDNVLDRMRETIDTSVIDSFAENGDAMIRCSIRLFLGYVDNAIEVAESYGGGGGGSSNDLEWGRKPDEDDRKWALRCILMAHRLLKPSARARVRR